MTDRAHGDPQDMRGTVESSADQWAAALDLALASEVAVPAPARAVVVIGMGGSGITGDVAAVLAAGGGGVPVIPVRDYRLPAWCGPDTPVVAVSHSGGTEETLAATRQALDRGCPVLAVTSGGALADLVAAAGRPVASIPSGGQPRAAIAHLTVPLLVALDRGGHLPDAVAQLRDLPDQLRARRAEWADEPDRVAAELADRVPVFVGGAGISGVVAHRARCQVNENAERPAFEASLPEADHNAIVGWGGGPRLPLAAVEIVDDNEHPRTLQRHDVTAAVLGADLPCVHRLMLRAATPISRLAEGVLWVDLLSVHLALDAGIDPTPVDRISDLKHRMATAEESHRVG